MTATSTALTAELHPFETVGGAHVFVTDGSRVYDVQPSELLMIRQLLDGTSPAEWTPNAASILHALLPSNRARHVDAEPLAPSSIQSLSLNVAQACNMSCGYCYADEGAFGGRSRMMSFDTAKAAVDRLLLESAVDSPVVVGFMGGEPLLARGLVHEVTRYAAVAAADGGRVVRFSITTNGTLLTAEDVRLFAEFPFTVTVSLDGPPEINRRLRLLNDGGDAYSRVISRLELFRCYGRPRHLSARVTVTPVTGQLLPLLDHVIGLGFDAVGFSPVLVSPRPALAFCEEKFAALLDQMIACGTKALEHACDGRPYPFDNFHTAMHEIHRGTHRPYPCGAGAAYLSVDAGGDLYACHRLINDPSFDMGDVRSGPDQERRAAHLRAGHVDRIEPCRRCWARYLCGGGCYHEVANRGRVACDYIRGWLHFCLQSYVALSDACPAYFEGIGMAGAFERSAGAASGEDAVDVQ